ncbi:MAG: bifunctional 5,10-methylenetetrahydrofolate dehydrogenase/5,10-methenyltetrahydrofolate cyclohydrolase [Candidatus Omnitrophota bacterium]
MAKLLEGKLLSLKIREDLKLQIAALGRRPGLLSILVGENPASEVYIRTQKKACEEVGIDYRLEKFAATISEAELIAAIQKFNQDKTVAGIIIQLPLPANMDYKKVCASISPKKDADGIHPENIGKIVFGTGKILPATAASAVELIKSTGVNLYGKEVVVVGHSEIVGKPVALLLLDKFATVTVCHIGTSQAGKLEEHVRRAEILVVAVGKANLIRGEWIKEGAIVIDVGINRAGDKIVGDVEFSEAEKRAGFITPVPGGVGPLTVTMLLRNVVESANDLPRKTPNQ